METIFSLGSLLVMPFWALMIFLPRWRVTLRAVRSPAIALGPAVLYAVLVLPRLGEVLPVVSDPTLPLVVALLGEPSGALIGWMHFLAFDLFVARWIFLDARERGVSSWLVSPLLVFVLLLGPLAYLAYFPLRLLARKKTPEVSPARA